MCRKGYAGIGAYWRQRVGTCTVRYVSPTFVLFWGHVPKAVHVPCGYRLRNAFASAAMPVAQVSLFSAGGAWNGSSPATPRIASHRGRA